MVEQLHPKLVNFYYTCKENYNTHLENSDAELEPVFIIPEDETKFHDISSWTNNKLQTEIAKLVYAIGNSGLSSRYSNILKGCPRRKSELICLLEDIKEVSTHCEFPESEDFADDD